MNPKDWTENQSKKVFMQFFLADLQKKKKKVFISVTHNLLQFIQRIQKISVDSLKNNKTVTTRPK